MYIFIETNKDIAIGEVVVIKSDYNGGIGAFLIGGERIGELAAEQPDGCLDYWEIARVLYDNRVLCKAAIKCGAAVILHTDSRLFAEKCTLGRVEVAGYGVAVLK